MNEQQPPSSRPKEPSLPGAPPQPGPPAPLPAGTYDSAELLKNRREVTIRHGEEIYRLRLTKSGKLILHK